MRLLRKHTEHIAAILICCEGKTEKLYFDIIVDVFRVHAVSTLKIVGEKGSYKTLIDQTNIERSKLAERFDISSTEIMCWAVCDDDNMPISYHELVKYAESKDVYVAFSRPQFEAYLIQHFEQSKDTDPRRLYDRLTKYSKSYGLHVNYEKNKGNLAWLNKAIFNNPHLVDVAITNSNQRLKQSEPLYLTVQNLTEYLRDLEPK
jgi:hypothetical protein